MTLTRQDTQAFAELIDLLQSAEQEFLNARHQEADVEVADCYRNIMSLVSLGIDTYINNDSDRPRLVRMVSDSRKFGGDNAHAYNDCCPLDSRRSYLLTGNIGSVAYLGFTVYGGDNEEQVHITSNHNSNDLTLFNKGNFQIVLSPHDTDDRAPLHIQLKPESHILVIRQYFLDAAKENPPGFTITPLDNIGKPPLLNADMMAKKLRSMASFIRGWTKILPLPWPPMQEAYNQVCPPFQASLATGHYSTPDNIHAFGFYQLAEDEALILRGKSVECLYWSCHLWNGCMASYDYTQYQCALSQKDIELAEDGSWQLIIAHKTSGLPNWLETAGYSRGFIYFRWLLVKDMPTGIQCEKVKLADIGIG